MLKSLLMSGLALAALGLALWLTGALDGLGQALAAAQRAMQDQLAGAIRALRGGEAGALAVFWAMCFGYGVLHAAGPGHGKMIIGGYGVARRVPLGRLAGLALASSLAQAAVAVALVYAVVALLGQARGAVQDAADGWMTPVGHAMIAALGLWLVWRGLSGIRAATAACPPHGQSPGHAHGHHHHPHDPAPPRQHVHGPHCAHAHGPTLDEAARITGWRDAAALVGGIALRPCIGALFVLVLTWQLGIALAGIAGAFVMGLGTAGVTVGVAVMAVWLREGALAALPVGRVARVLPFVELVLGGVIAAAALGLLAATF